MNTTWTRATVDSQEHWYRALPPTLTESLASVVAAQRQRPAPLTSIDVWQTPLAAFESFWRPVRQTLEHGRGFIILHGVPRAQYSLDEWRLIYWLVGQLLGQPMAQNVQGTILYDVVDTGQDVQYGARFSVTNAESTFHTDNSFGAEVLDYVGLLCWNTAKSGGLSQMVHAYAVHERLRQQYPQVVSLLSEPFEVDRRGGVLPGEKPTVPVPVFTWNDGVLLCRYLRYWIEVGQEKAGKPLSAQQREALDALDRVAALPELRVEFALKPGDMYFINNRWILHNRTAFVDHAEPEQKRHLVRLWLKAYKK